MCLRVWCVCAYLYLHVWKCCIRAIAFVLIRVPGQCLYMGKKTCVTLTLNVKKHIFSLNNDTKL